MIRIAISAAAYEAIKASVGVDGSPPYLNPILVMPLAALGLA
jgi:hypothetical protein